MKHPSNTIIQIVTTGRRKRKDANLTINILNSSYAMYLRGRNNNNLESTLLSLIFHCKSELNVTVNAI